jgi:phenylacetate-coenzyme A ligase PaaK-like adenylate-forming protein
LLKRLGGSLVVMAHLPAQRRIPHLSRRRIEARRDAAVRRIVAYAARTVPHYRELFAREGIDPRGIRGVRELDAMPLLDAEAVRADPERFTSESRRAGDALALVSGSVTGPLVLRHDRRSVLANIAYGERERAPVIQLCGGSFRPRELHIGYETSNFRKVLEFYAQNTRLPRPHRESLSMVAPFEDIVAAINSVRPDLLTAYGGFLDVFFRTVVARGAEIHAPRVVMYVGETLPADRREWIERELGARVMSRYCATEAFKIGYFCEERTGFHLHDDLCHVRVLRPDGRDAAPDEPGEVVISNLVNHGTVLLNYPMGDLAAISSVDCPCGRGHRLLSELHGRVEDMLPLANGEHLHPRAVWSVFKEDPRVLQYQLVQHDLRRFALKLVTADVEAFARSRDRAVQELRALLGGEAEIETTRHVQLGREERERTGKFRAVESRVAGAIPRRS